MRPWCLGTPHQAFGGRAGPQNGVCRGVEAPVIYVPKFVADPDEAFARLRDELTWERRDDAPRSEYYCNDHNVPYTYGRGAGVRTYMPQVWHPTIMAIRKALEAYAGCTFDVCFLNMYLNQKDQLGRHADDSPEMDDARPIATISLGVEREIWFYKKGEKGVPTDKLKLEHGSLGLMAAGMQDTHDHRIPKASFECGVRISLTFRGYVLPV